MKKNTRYYYYYFFSIVSEQRKIFDYVTVRNTVNRNSRA